MEKKLSFYVGIGAGVATIIVYAYTTFATVDFVKSYVDVRHTEILRRLDEMNSTLEKLVWQKGR